MSNATPPSASRQAQAWPHRLGRQLGMALLLKLALLGLLWALFFGPQQRPSEDAQHVSSRLMLPSAPPATEGPRHE